MPDETTAERVAAALYAARRPSYVPLWADAPAGHAMKETCLRDAQIALDVIKEREAE